MWLFTIIYRVKVKCDTEEIAVSIAKEYLLDEALRIRVGVEQVCNLIGWWKE